MAVWLLLRVERSRDAGQWRGARRDGETRRKRGGGGGGDEGRGQPVKRRRGSRRAAPRAPIGEGKPGCGAHRDAQRRDPSRSSPAAPPGEREPSVCPGRAPAGRAAVPCSTAVRPAARRRWPIDSAATAVARRPGGDCEAAGRNVRARARSGRIRLVRRVRAGIGSARFLWQPCGGIVAMRPIHLVGAIRARSADLPSGAGSWLGTGVRLGYRADELASTHPVNRSPLDRRRGVAKHKHKPGLARSATGAAPGHVAEEGVCKRWTLLILACVHTDMDQALSRRCR